MTTESDPITEKVPTVTTPAAATAQRATPHEADQAPPGGSLPDPRRGLATASTFGLVAVLGNRAQAAEADAAVAAAAAVETATTAPPRRPPPTTAPPPVVVVRRTYVQVDGGTPPSAWFEQLHGLVVVRQRRRTRTAKSAGDRGAPSHRTRHQVQLELTPPTDPDVRTQPHRHRSRG